MDQWWCVTMNTQKYEDSLNLLSVKFSVKP